MQRRASQIVPWVGIAVHLVIGPAYALAGLLAPPWAVAALWAIWIALLVMAIRVRRSRPWLAAATPLISAAVWLGLLTLGERLLGWTA
ncbi:hypothetical protein [Sorangium cellulosum]|uniref:Uncharacterized protein n=1 Tax=Sorangium cellulosum So0157-2 TaxID=1254432 RepID=S4XSU2_SORCE|nr:hypothetical protein [Sorangium cellulosum]AGP33658.1 hypothetical protein SCE1572_03590 [Sorangium cellulosum So0157-2]